MARIQFLRTHGIRRRQIAVGYLCPSLAGTVGQSIILVLTAARTTAVSC